MPLVQSLAELLERNPEAQAAVEKYAAKEGVGIEEATEKLFPSLFKQAEKGSTEETSLLTTGKTPGRGEGFTVRSGEPVTEGPGFSLKQPVDKSKLPAIRERADLATRSPEPEYLPPEEAGASESPETVDTTAYSDYPGTGNIEPGQDRTVTSAKGPRKNWLPAAAFGAGAALASSGDSSDSQNQDQELADTSAPSAEPGKGAGSAGPAGMAPTVKEAVQKAAGAPETGTEPTATATTPASATAAATGTSGRMKSYMPAIPKETEADLFDKYEQKIQQVQKEQQGPLNQKLDDLKVLENTYRTEQQNAKSDIERKELAETLGHAFAQFGAGLQGLKSGIDMTTGLKFNKTDWNKRYEQALDELKTNLTDLREKRQEVKATGLEERREAERMGERGLRAEATGLEQRRTEAFQAREEELNRQSREAIAKLSDESRQEVANIKAQMSSQNRAMKLDAEQKKGLEEASNNYVNSYVAEQQEKDPKAKAEQAKLRVKYEGILAKNYGAKFMTDVKGQLEGSSIFTGDFSTQAERAAKAQETVGKRQQEAAPAGFGTPAPTGQPTGQTSAAGGTVQVKDVTKGSPTFGQVKSVKNSDKVQQLIQSGKLQLVGG